jgi:hypothetical protein
LFALPSGTLQKGPVMVVHGLSDAVVM